MSGIFPKLITNAYKSRSSDVENYVFEKNLSNSNVKTYSKGNEFIIVHNGTNLSSPDGKRDLISDINILFGKEDYDSQFKSRTSKTKSNIKRILKANPDAEISLLGHSLGGATAIHSMQDKFVNENVKRVETFNIGVSPFNNPSKGFKGDPSKIHNNIVIGDPISNSALIHHVGSIELHNPDEDVSLSKKVIKALSNASITDAIISGLAAHSISNFF